VTQQAASSRPTIVISGSLAFDHIMTYPGSFQDHIIPGKVRVLSVSFLFDSLRRQRGGVAGNIAYSFALLGEKPALVGAGGTDFGDYRATFESLGIDMTNVSDVPDELTGSSFMIADQSGNQIAGFYPGASSVSDQLSVLRLGHEAAIGIVAPTTLEAMRLHAQEFAECGCRLVYDASQQVVSLSPDDLRDGIERAWCVIGSDYELAVIGQKTGLSVDQLAERVPLVGMTLGKLGSELYSCGRRIAIPPAPPAQIGEPTGGGDAYRAGFFKGLLLGLPLEVAGRMASLAATYVVERHGPQEHFYTVEEFVARFDAVFPDFAGAIDVAALGQPVARDQAMERLARLA
jgi:adenosine kinase